MLRKTVLTLLAAATLASTAAVAAPAQAAVDPGTGQHFASARVVVPMVFPVVGATSYSDNFLACRSGCARMHMGQDLMGPKLSALVATFDGVVTALSRDSSSGNTVGITATSGPAKGWTAMYLHVNNDTPRTDDGRGTAGYAFPKGIELGSRVLAGQLIGWRGDSGNAEGTSPHLHFELRAGTGWGGVVYNAYPSLRAARRLASPVASGPHPSGTVVQVASGQRYLLADGLKHPISGSVFAANGYAAHQLVRISSAEAALYPTSTVVRVREGAVLQDSTGTTWVVSDGKRVRAPLAQLTAVAPRVFPIGMADLVRLPLDSRPLAEVKALLGGVVEGSLVRQLGTGTVHRVEDGVLRPYLAEAVGAAGIRGVDVTVLPLLPELALGVPIGLRDGTLVAVPGKLGVVSQGTYRRLRDVRQINDYGYRGMTALRLPASAVADLQEVELTTDLSRVGGHRYRD